MINEIKLNEWVEDYKRVILNLKLSSDFKPLTEIQKELTELIQFNVAYNILGKPSDKYLEKAFQFACVYHSIVFSKVQAFSESKKNARAVTKKIEELTEYFKKDHKYKISQEVKFNMKQFF